MERPFGSYEKASEAVLPRLLESRGSVQQIQHQRENDERELFPDWSSTTTIRKIPARSWMMVKARTRPFTRFNPFYSKRKLFCA